MTGFSLVIFCKEKYAIIEENPLIDTENMARWNSGNEILIQKACYFPTHESFYQAGQAVLDCLIDLFNLYFYC